MIQAPGVRAGTTKLHSNETNVMFFSCVILLKVVAPLGWRLSGTMGENNRSQIRLACLKAFRLLRLKVFIFHCIALRSFTTWTNFCPKKKKNRQTRRSKKRPSKHKISFLPKKLSFSFKNDQEWEKAKEGWQGQSPAEERQEEPSAAQRPKCDGLSSDRQVSML
jgi:hypothetical protein